MVQMAVKLLVRMVIKIVGRLEKWFVWLMVRMKVFMMEMIVVRMVLGMGKMIDDGGDDECEDGGEVK